MPVITPSMEAASVWDANITQRLYMGLKGVHTDDVQCAMSKRQTSFYFSESPSNGDCC